MGSSWFIYSLPIRKFTQYLLCRCVSMSIACGQHSKSKVRNPTLKLTQWQQFPNNIVGFTAVDISTISWQTYPLLCRVLLPQQTILMKNFSKHKVWLTYLRTHKVLYYIRLNYQLWLTRAIFWSDIETHNIKCAQWLRFSCYIPIFVRKNLNIKSIRSLPWPDSVIKIYVSCLSTREIWKSSCFNKMQEIVLIRKRCGGFANYLILLKKHFLH